MVKSAQRTIQILNTIAQSDGGMTHSQLAKALNIPSGSLTPLLNTLVTLRCLNINPAARLYTIGPTALSLAKGYLDRLEIVQVGQPLLVEAVRRTGESASIATLDHNEILIVAKVNSPHPLRRSLEIGERVPLYASATGKAMLAMRSDEEIRHYLSQVELKPFTRQTIVDHDAFWREIEHIRGTGISYSRAAILDGVSAAATLIYDGHKAPAGGLSISGPSVRFDPDKEKIIEQTLREVSAAISHRLGYPA